MLVLSKPDVLAPVMGHKGGAMDSRVVDGAACPVPTRSLVWKCSWGRGGGGAGLPGHSGP